MSRMCENCVYYDRCNEDEVCEDFAYAIDEMMTDQEVDELVESNRNEYYSSWNTYLYGFYN